MTIKQQMKQKVETLLEHNRLYYDKDDPEISDRKYDLLLRSLRAYERKHPKYILANSPTRNVGSVISTDNAKRTPHPSKMYSLDNAFDKDEFKKWILPKVTYCIEPKYDGLSLNLIYTRGWLTQAITRGDGLIGEDVTAQAKQVASIPQRLNKKPYPDSVEVRGEVYLTERAYTAVNIDRYSRKKDIYKSIRNGAAGAFRQDNLKLVKRAHLTFTPYGIGTHPGMDRPATQIDALKQMTAWGFIIPKMTGKAAQLTTCVKAYDRIKKACEVSGIPADGVVYKVNDIKLQRIDGFTNKYPNWAIAWKFPDALYTTVLEKVTVQVGRTGKLTPVAQVGAVNIKGVTVTSCTLHNYDEIKRLSVRIGDTISIKRAGDVIPKILGRVKKGQSREMIKPPTECPVCASAVRKEDVFYYCTNEHCEGRLLGSLLHFVNREAMDIDGLGPALLKTCIDTGLIKSIHEIYNLSSARKFGGKTWANAYDAIDKSKQAHLNRFLYALGIHTLGRTMAKDLCKRYRTITDIKRLKESDLIKMDDVGPIGAKSIVDWFKDPINKKLLNHLLAPWNIHLTNPLYIEEDAFLPLAGNTYVITGTLSKISRRDAKAKLEVLGAKVAGTVSKRTTMVFAGPKAGSKLTKAGQLSVPVGDEAALIKLIN